MYSRLLGIRETAGLRTLSRIKPEGKVLKSVVICGLLGSAALTGTFAARLKGKEMPEGGLHPSQEVLDFGTKNQGDKPRGSFLLTNHYPFEIKITDIWTSCGCTVPSGYAKQLKPGESTTVGVDWFLGNKRGNVSDKITVVYSQPKEISSRAGLIPLHIRANVLPEIQVEPMAVEFTRTRPGKATIHLAAGTKKDFQVKKVYANVDFIQAVWHPESGAIECTFEPPLHRGRDLSGVQVLIETESEVEKLIRVRVNVVSESDRGVSPSKEF